MRKPLVVIGALVIMGAGTLLLGTEATTDAGKPSGAMIMEWNRTARPTAIRVPTEKLGELEAFFSNYRALPQSKIAGAWEAGYYVYFDFPHGKAIRVTVSTSPEARYWSVGDGDFLTQGNFGQFVKKLP